MLSGSTERFWVVTDNPRHKLLNQLVNYSLWIHCGFNGMKLWLPLSDQDTVVNQSNRIILNFSLNFYPISKKKNLYDKNFIFYSKIKKVY